MGVFVCWEMGRGVGCSPSTGLVVSNGRSGSKTKQMLLLSSLLDFKKKKEKKISHEYLFDRLHFLS